MCGGEGVFLKAPGFPKGVAPTCLKFQARNFNFLKFGCRNFGFLKFQARNFLTWVIHKRAAVEDRASYGGQCVGVKVFF